MSKPILTAAVMPLGPYVEPTKASLLPANPPPATDVAGDAVASVSRVRHQRTSPGETDWLLKNGTTIEAPIAALPFPQLMHR